MAHNFKKKQSQQNNKKRFNPKGKKVDRNKRKRINSSPASDKKKPLGVQRKPPRPGANTKPTINSNAAAEAKPDSSLRKKTTRVSFDPKVRVKKLHGGSVVRTPSKSSLDRSMDSTTSEATATPRSILKTKQLRQEDKPDDVKKGKKARVEIVPSKKPVRVTKKGEVIVDKRVKSENTLRIRELQAKPALDHKERKELKRLRRMNRPNYKLLVTAKQMWETIRCKKTPPDVDKAALVQQLYDLVAGKVAALVQTHDGARVVQTLLAVDKLTQSSLRDALFEEMKDTIYDLVKTRYGRFFVAKMLKYGTNENRAYILQQFHGHVSKLLSHTFASNVLEVAYNDFANVRQRVDLISEFYRPEYMQFKPDDPKLSLRTVLEEFPQEKSVILDRLHKKLCSLSTKNVFNHSLVHHLFREHIEVCSAEQRAELIDCLKDRLMELAHTRDGVEVVMQCLWHGSVKERKTIVKSMKSHVKKLALDRYGHLALLAAFDCVDDTKLLKEYVLKEIIAELPALVETVDDHGSAKKVLMYLCKRRDHHNFKRSYLRILQAGDGNAVSKKEADVREQELLEAMSPALLEYVVTNMKTLVLGRFTARLVISVIMNCLGDKQPCYDALARIVAEPFEAGRMEDLHIIEHPHGHFAMLCLFLHDRQLVKESKPTLTETLLKTVPQEQMQQWIACNKGCFTLYRMQQTNLPGVDEQLRSLLQPVLKTLQGYSFIGAKHLIEHLKLATGKSPRGVVTRSRKKRQE